MDATRVPLRLFQGKRHRIPLTCGPASKSLHPIFRQASVGSERSHRHACLVSSTSRAAICWRPRPCGSSKGEGRGLRASDRAWPNQFALGS
jgi:hypothetical protein